MRLPGEASPEIMADRFHVFTVEDEDDEEAKED
jgi:hypothetical protein